MTEPNATVSPPPLPWDGQPYSVKRHGVNVDNCDTEPVQTPGCVQAHGALLVLRPGLLTVAQASENCADVLGHAAHDLLGRSVERVLGADGAARLGAFIAAEPVLRNPLYAFSVAGAGGMPLDLVVHTTELRVYVEFEPSGPPPPPGTPVPDIYALLKKSVVRLQSAPGLQAFCDTLSEEVRALTGLDRVMVYRFHPDLHGEVVAEAKRADLPTWLGLHYPADDIPLPAREIFKRIWVRPMPDIDGGLAEMVPLVDPDTGTALEMTHCVLRGASVMYTEYLHNMQVTAGLTMPIRSLDGSQLWGLIACHHYAGPKRVGFQQRAACEFLAQVASLQYRSVEESEHLQSRMALESVQQTLVARASRDGLLRSMLEGQPSLLHALPSQGVAFYEAGRWWREGRTPDDAELDALALWLKQRPSFVDSRQRRYETDRLAQQFPPAAAYADMASGVLALSLVPGSNVQLLWFREEQLQSITWAGSPHDKPKMAGPHGQRLTPRASFEKFVESVRGCSAPWRAHEIDSAARMRLLLMELVIARTESLALLNLDLARSNEDLDAFAHVASHDLKEPLRGIHKYAHQLREDAALAGESQQRKVDNLMRLTVRMDSLLDALLLYSRVGRETLELDDCDMNELVAEALEMVDSRRAEDAGDIVIPRPFERARCDWIRGREIFVNLLSNALKYNDKPMKRIEVGWVGAGEARPASEPARTQGSTLYYVRDNGIGIDARNHEQIFKMFKRLHARDAYGGGSGAGLAIVKKLIERHRGEIWLESEPGAGCVFYFTLPANAVGSAA